MIHEVTTAYADAGATAVDIVDGDLTADIIEFQCDADVLGEYSVSTALPMPLATVSTSRARLMLSTPPRQPSLWLAMQL